MRPTNCRETQVTRIVIEVADKSKSVLQGAWTRAAAQTRAVADPDSEPRGENAIIADIAIVRRERLDSIFRAIAERQVTRGRFRFVEELCYNRAKAAFGIDWRCLIVDHRY